MTRIAKVCVAMTMMALAVLVAQPASAQTTVWNVEFGNYITTGDDYIGAATENTANSTWNQVRVANQTGLTLADSTGDSSAGVTFAVTVAPGDTLPTQGNTTITQGDEIFRGWAKGAGNNTDFTCTFANLNPSATYDIVVYADWYWSPSGAVVPVTLTAGTGLTGTFYINTGVSGGSTDDTGPLLEDTNPANLGTANANYARLGGLTPDAGGNLGLTVTGGNYATSGFQLVEHAPVTTTPGTLIYGK